MNRIEEVTEIIKRYKKYPIRREWDIADTAWEINQLYEPQNRVGLLSYALRNVLRRAGVINSDTEPSEVELIMAADEYCESEPQPDQSRLLTLDEILLIKEKYVGVGENKTRKDIRDYVFAVRDAQDAKTASIKDAEHEKLWQMCSKEIAKVDRKDEARMEALIRCLGLSENELGYCEIINHIPYSMVKELIDFSVATHCKANPTSEVKG